MGITAKDIKHSILLIDTEKREIKEIFSDLKEDTQKSINKIEKKS